MPLTWGYVFRGGIYDGPVRYASVGAGFWGPCGPRTVVEPATDGRGQAHGRARAGLRTTAERATGGAGGTGYTDWAAPRFPDR